MLVNLFSSNLSVPRTGEGIFSDLCRKNSLGNSHSRHGTAGVNKKPKNHDLDALKKSIFWIGTHPLFSNLAAWPGLAASNLLKKIYYLQDLRYPAPCRSKKEGAVGRTIYDFNELLF